MTYDKLKENLNVKKVLNQNEMTDLLFKYSHISKNTKSIEYYNKNIMPMKIGNDKIGTDTLIINMSTCFNCYSYKNGYCKAKKCYGKALQEIYPNSLLYGMACEINWNRLSEKDIIKQIDYKFLENDIKFIRFNEFGEMKNINDFNKTNNIAKYVNKEYDAISYLYTSNKELDIDTLINSNIVTNFSYDTNRDDTKMCSIINKNEVKQYLKDDDVIICNGKCLHCPYCKNKNEFREVKFIKHGNGQSIQGILKEILTKKQLNELEANKLIDYGLFLKNKS